MSTAATDKVKILDAADAKAKIKRMAYEIYESNFGSSELVVVGLNQRGAFLADLLSEQLENISPLKVARLNAHREQETVRIEGNPAEAIKACPVVVVDDVLYSGKTLFLAVAAVMAHQPKRVQTAVLIDRGHRSLPVTHDFVGMLLATTLQQHVSVEIAEEQTSAIAYVQ